MAFTLNLRQFPEMMKHELPQKWGTLSATGFRTPSYNYGWIMPILNLLKSLQREDLMNEEVTPNNAECCAIIPKWNQEYAAQFGKDRRPRLSRVGPRLDLVLVYIAGNDTVEEMAEVVRDKDYVEACLDFLNHPEDLKGVEPVWFRSALKDTPEGYKKYDIDPDFFDHDSF